MGELAILVPVLGRPHRVQPLLDSIARTTPDALVVFLADPLDYEELRAIRVAHTPLNVLTLSLGGNYAHKINDGVSATTEPLIFTAADDLEFHAGWLDAAKAKLRAAQVVGVNDLIPRTRDHATHFLLTREYANQPTIDGQRGPMFEGYKHWCCDDELIGTATHRGVYDYARLSVVEHFHPYNDKAAWDSTYELGHVNRRHDKRLLRQRKRLWT